MARPAELDSGDDFVYLAYPPTLLCPICVGPLSDPVQTPQCQHLFCRPCLARALESAALCPVDRSPLHHIDSCTAPPRPIRQLLDDLAVQCAHPACRKQLRLEEWPAHARACPARNPPTADSDSAERDETSAGDDAEPPSKQCDLCHADLAAQDVDSHPSVCPAVPLPCAYCTLHLARASHPAHLQHSCPLVPLPCPHAAHGCPFAGPRAQLHDEHLASECAYEPIRACLERYDALVLELEADNWALRKRVNRAEDRLAHVEHSLDALRTTLGTDFFPPSLSPAPARPSSPSSSSSKRPRSRPSSPSPSVPPLPSQLSTLRASHTHLSSSLHALEHAHLHQSHDLAALRAQLAGVRLHVADWIMLDRRRGGAYGPPGAGAGVGMQRRVSDESAGDLPPGGAGEGGGGEDDGAPPLGPYLPPLLGGRAALPTPPGQYGPRYGSSSSGGVLGYPPPSGSVAGGWYGAPVGPVAAGEYPYAPLPPSTLLGQAYARGPGGPLAGVGAHGAVKL
ncbi:uncharacterized protein JCM10292_001409 [Rhodotorula paludigena]|uniref:uncharacterized protein n=1 Tax=Rhodotorula paludigena TaxID=86838 RepID=UPI003174D81F